MNANLIVPFCTMLGDNYFMKLYFSMKLLILDLVFDM